MSFNGSGARDLDRALKTGINTIIRALKKLSSRLVTSEKLVLDDVTLISELDEQWACVGNKNHRHWLWYTSDAKKSE
jgi:hypothetical protein